MNKGLKKGLKITGVTVARYQSLFAFPECVYRIEWFDTFGYR